MSFKHHTKALVVLSGGQDSTICLFWALKHFDDVHAITFDYGQRHRREIIAAQQVAQLAGIGNKHEILTVGDLLKGRSPLTDKSAALETYPSFEEMDKTIGDRVELTFVPMRNAFFLTLAANRAACLEVTDLITGVCQADNANYPDCRKTFIDAQERAINEALGTKSPEFRILTPLMFIDKAQSILMARGLNNGAYEALAFSHTAYSGEYPPVTQDHATVLRAHGFEQAGVPDPLIVRAHMEGLAPLPQTPNYADIGFIKTLGHKIEAMAEVLGSPEA